MMKAVVVHSANDATMAVAEYVAGSGPAFVVMMNQRAKELGMKDTHYYSPHGLPPAPGQQADISSAYDTAVLARELIKYPDVLRWSSIDVTGFRNNTFELRNTNHLVRTYQRLRWPENRLLRPGRIQRHCHRQARRFAADCRGDGIAAQAGKLQRGRHPALPGIHGLLRVPGRKKGHAD